MVKTLSGRRGDDLNVVSLILILLRLYVPPLDMMMRLGRLTYWFRDAVGYDPSRGDSVSVI